MRRASAAAVASFFVIAGAAGCGAAGEEVGRGAEYVALGDSYTAGPGMEPVADRSCGRSEINYPSLVDKALKIESFADRSCAGARTADLTAPQKIRDPTTHLLVEVNDPQLDAVGKDTKLVTIGMGLNDGAIAAGLLLTCTAPTEAEPDEACEKYLQQPQSAIEAQISKAADNLEAALATIAQKAPEAQIVLVGYPRVVPDEGGCGSPGHVSDLLPMPDAQLTRLRDAFKFVNEVWRETAHEAGASYVDMYAPSEGHDICSDDPWIAGYLPVPGKAVGLHPFPSYAKAVSEEIVKLLKSE